MEQKKIEKLYEWQQKFETALTEFEAEHDAMNRGILQYEGKLQPEKGKEVKAIYNFTKELIESAIDVTVPMPKVEPVKKTEKNIRLARTIEAMLVNEIKRIDFETLNDKDERTTKKTGGDVALVEWDNKIRTHTHVGDLDVRLISPLRFTPQPGIKELNRMDYFFLDFEDTKQKIKQVYGVDVEDESIDRTRVDAEATDERVTMKWAFYKNKKGSLGVFAWAGDTIIIDDEMFQARTEEVCVKCGASRPIGEQKCNCGSSHWTTRHLDYEELEDDLTLNDGTVIPALTPARDEYGDFILQPVEAQATEMNQFGMEMPVFERIFDNMGNIIGDRPVMKTEMLPYDEPTKIPYYIPKRYPVCLRINVSTEDKVFGDSDTSIIEELQMETNKTLTKLFHKVGHNGQILSKLKKTNFNFENDLQVIEVDTIDELSAIKTFDLRFDPNGDINIVNQNYYWAKSLLGINDSSQGKADPTAMSGRAKEAQIARAQARQSSKITMKNTFYKSLYYSMFEYALAYMDEARGYQYHAEDGEDEELIFNRYDFLELGQDGKYYYNDQFIITIDQMAGITENRETVLEMMQADYQAGLYGDQQDPETTLMFWKDRANLNYPNAQRQVARWEKKVKEYKEQIEQMQNQQMGDIMQMLTQGEPEREVEDNAMPM